MRIFYHVIAMEKINHLERVVSDAEEYYQGLESDLGGARESVRLEVYIFHNDPLGRRIARALAQAARRGVSVKLIIDGVGTPHLAKALELPITEAGVQILHYHPVVWGRWLRSVLRGNFRAWFARVNRRNHRKTCIIDGAIAWVGSFNITDDHLPKSRSRGAWRDVAVRVSGAALTPLIDAFDALWYSRAPERNLVPRGQTQLFRLNNTHRRRTAVLRDLKKRISSSQQRIWIATAYFVPRFRVLAGLIHAARRGVDVRILLSAESDVAFIPWVAAQLYKQLLRSGVRIFEYEGGNLHSKTLLIDQWGVIGTSNLNHRSILLDLEVDVILQTQEAILELERITLRDLEGAREVRPGDRLRTNWIQNLIGKLLLKIRRWL